jgi:hypothetical protein
VWYENNQKLEELINEHLFDVRWREVFILVAGVASKADDLLERMQKVAEKRLVEASQAFRLLQWTKSWVTFPDDTEKAAAQRALALALPLSLERAHAHALIRTHTFGRANDLVRHLDLDLILALDLDLDLIHFLVRPYNIQLQLEFDRAIELLHSLKDLSAVLDSIRDFLPFSGAWQETVQRAQATLAQFSGQPPSKAIDEAWAQALDGIADALLLPPYVRATRDKPIEWRELADYLYACNLIVACKNAATRVNRSTWESICKRMMNPAEQSPLNAARRGHRRKK